METPLSRRTVLGLALGVPVSMALAACGTAGPGTGGATYWYLNGQPQEGVRTGAVDRFNKANPDRDRKSVV